jgi:hypothetical protein
MLSVAMLERIAYYEGTQRLASLGVSVPQQLANVRTVVDWPRVCIDPLIPVRRGGRLPAAGRDRRRLGVRRSTGRSTTWTRRRRWRSWTR